jgi:hypothetical protein
MTQKAAIVTTLRNPGSSLDSFLRYHFAIGFSHFFLFFDDSQDPSIPTARKYRRVSIIRNDARLQRKWATTKIATTNPGFYEFLESEFKVRQTLNVEIAIDLARKKKVDWLLHIDCDELFYSFHGNAREHFQTLADRKLNNVVYANYEGIPEAVNIDDYFQRVTLFKRNFFLDPRLRLNARQRTVIRQVRQIPEHLFLFYANGKSAARVTSGLQPDGGHRFTYQKPVAEKFATRRKTEPVICNDAVILHYPCCSFKSFWSKYKLLGPFADRWFDQVDIAEAIGSFHLESRDVVALNNQAVAKSFYRDRAVINDPQVVQRLINSGLACRIEEPLKLLRESAGQKFFNP